MRAVRPKPSPAVLSRSFATGISEVSRFSCMKYLGVLWGLRLRRTEQELALLPLFMLPSARSRAFFTSYTASDPNHDETQRSPNVGNSGDSLGFGTACSSAAHFASAFGG